MHLAGAESKSLDGGDAAFALLECEKEAVERAPVDGNERVGRPNLWFWRIGARRPGLPPTLKTIDGEIVVVYYTYTTKGPSGTR